MYGFVKVGVAVPRIRVADCRYNARQIIEKVKMAWEQKVKVLVLPELVMTGYTCGDLFFQKTLLSGALRGLVEVVEATKEMDMLIAVGMPIAIENEIFNCSVVICEGKIVGIVPKRFIPNYNEFYEKRWFAAGRSLKCKVIEILGQEVPIGNDLLFKLGEEAMIGVEMCEDVWTPIPPSSVLCMEGAEIILNLSASNETISKRSYRQQLISQQSARCMCGYVYASAGIGESTTDIVFSGHGMICENGAVKAENEKLIDGDYVLVTEIDVERLQAERQKCKSYKDCQMDYSREMRVIKIALEGDVNYKIGSKLENQEIDTVENNERSNIENSNINNRECNCQSDTRENVGRLTESNAEKERIKKSYRDKELSYTIARKPFVPHNKLTRDARCKEILSLQVAGLKGRLEHTRSKRVVVGISGGLDSTLALLVCVEAFEELGWDKKGIVGVTMPGFGTTDRTYENAVTLMKELGITLREIPIREACMQHFKDIEHDSNIHDVLYENVQARERTKILMDVANQGGGFVVGTGDLSELALGWCTYNGDHMSMYAVNVSVPKTLVRSLVGSVAKERDEKVRKVLEDIIATPVSPELLPASKEGEIVQKTEEVVGPYELHDFFLYYMLRFGFSPSKIFYLAQQAFSVKEDEMDCVYEKEEILKWMKIFYSRFFKQQFKRSCLPDGPKVGSICLSPRGDWRMPSDAHSTLWIEEIEALEEEATEIERKI